MPALNLFVLFTLFCMIYLQQIIIESLIFYCISIDFCHDETVLRRPAHLFRGVYDRLHRLLRLLLLHPQERAGEFQGLHQVHGEHGRGV